MAPARWAAQSPWLDAAGVVITVGGPENIEFHLAAIDSLRRLLRRHGWSS